MGLLVAVHAHRFIAIRRVTRLLQVSSKATSLASVRIPILVCINRATYEAVMTSSLPLGGDKEWMNGQMSKEMRLVKIMILI